mmetsp:Transcript_31814/g.83702  ORF Transcript_31814/g.83702 Transcript_31814/m.83702 type:complete len:430 (-) Transcript_31814:414-1703(-)
MTSHIATPFGVRVLRRADTKGLPEDLDLPGSRYGFGVSWDTIGQRGVDVDLQCVVVDNSGAIIDCAYYNNLKAVRAITHSGDESVGKPEHIGEMVWANMHRMPPNVSLLIFVVAAYSGGSLQDVTNGKLHVLEERQSREIALFEMERSTGSVDVVATMFRDAAGGWKMRIIDLPAQAGQHFMDILPLLSQVVRSFLPSAPQRQKVAFAMEKGGVLDLPMDLSCMTVGLGWDVDEGECDLDVSAVLLDSAGNDLETVFFGRLESEQHGITHSGDNLTGEGIGDDEQIFVNLNRIGSKVQQVVLCVNVYTKGKSFAQVAQPFCRIVDDASGTELCRYSLRDAGRESGLIIARIAREASGRWGFHALGLPCRGRTYKDSLPEIKAVCGVRTASLMLRTSTTQDLSVYAPASSEAVGRHAVGSSCGEKSCCVQ